MTEPAARPARRWWKYLLILVSAGVLVLGALSVYVNTESFQALVRRRLISEIERVTGGRAEVGSFHTVPFRMQVEVRNITVHGRESATDIPLAHADSVLARVKVISLFESQFAFHEVVLDQPVIHVAFYADGSTNVPNRTGQFSAKATIDQLLSLSISRLEVRQGRVLWDDQTIPLDFAARNTSLQMDYSYLHSRYDGRLSVGTVETKLLAWRPFSWMGSAEFSLSPDSAIVTSLKWNSGHSNLSANGQITSFRHPHLHALYDAQLDLAEAASISRIPQVRAGVLQLKGDGSWSLDQFDSRGLLTIRDLAWQDAQLALSKAALSTGYVVSDQQLTLSKLQGRILGGSFFGDAELNQWLASDEHLSPAARKSLETPTISAAHPLNKSSQASSRAKARSVQDARVSLQLRDISVETLAAALQPPDHPVQRLHPAGLASGRIETRWKGTRHDAETQFVLDVNPPAQLSPPQLPITAHANGTYYTATANLDLPQFNLTTPASHVQASGTLSSASSLRLSVSTSSLADWLPLLTAVRGPALFPVTLNGHATFNGNLTGPVSSPQIAGSLAVNGFEFDLPARVGKPPLKTQWDSLSTSLQVSFNAIALRDSILRRGETSAEFEASATLDHGHFVGGSILNVRASVQNANLTLLQSLAGYNYPVFGNADLQIEAAGTLSQPHAEGKIHLINAIAYGEPIRQFDSDFRLGDGEIAFDDLHLLYDDAVLTGRASYLPATRAYRLEVAGNNLDITSIRTLRYDRLPLEGRADFAVKASGTPNAPVMNGDIHIRNLTVNHEPFGDLDLHGSTQENELRLTGTSNLPQGSLAISGNVGLQTGHAADLSVRMYQVDLDALWHAYFGNQLTGHSAVAGILDLRGPLFQPAHWTINGDLSGLALEVEHVKLHNQDPVRFAITREMINVPQLHMQGQGTDVRAHGTVQFSAPYKLDVTADGQIDLNLVSVFNPDLTASGLALVNMTLQGTYDDPLPQGSLQLANGTVNYANLPSGLSDLSGLLRFTRDHAHLEALAARTGGGTVNLRGDISYPDRQLNFNLDASGKDVRLRYPPGVSSTADAEVRWSGSRSASSVSGEITITKMAVTPGFDFSSYLEHSRQTPTLTTANSPLNNIKLDVHVQTSPELQMRTAIARLSGDADLRVRGSVARPALLGRVDILEGQATFHGTRFTLERGDITFANPVSIEPQLNLQAATHVRNYDLNITITGTPDRGLNLNYRSEPPLPKSDIIALLALGRTGEESQQLQEQSGQAAYSDQATALILNQALNETVTSRFQRLFGASNIKIDPQGLTTETNPTGRGPQVTIEQEFANNLSLTYSTNVSQSSQQIIQGEYYFNRNLSVVGTRDQNGVVSFDVQVRRRKK
ncbi:MAG TPA: translocation/assembly module TamB domain-containing protein [Candidatus Sulfotelmatobacter sp.]